MKGALSIRLFAHSWVSDWNHGNAHFLRGLARELVCMGHQVRCYEETGAWSLRNLMREGEAAGYVTDANVFDHGKRCSIEHPHFVGTLAEDVETFAVGRKEHLDRGGVGEHLSSPAGGGSG